WKARRRMAEIICPPRRGEISPSADKKINRDFVQRKFKKDDLTIKVVDGEIVRKTLDPSFVAGGHGLIYPWYIPKQEIWLDGRIDRKELKYILAHEKHEYRLMQKGSDYNKAHDRACVIEKELRAKNGVAFYPKKNPIDPLHFIKIGNGKKRILITSGIHGDERSGPYTLIKFLLEKQNIKNLNADIIPLINPSGFEKETRENKNGKDPNRWFSDKSQKNEPQECKILKKFFSARGVRPRPIRLRRRSAFGGKKPYELLVSLHEDPDRKEFYLYSTGLNLKFAIIQKIFKTVKKFGIKLYTGMDTTNPRDLVKNFVKNGYVSVKWNNIVPTLEEYLSRNKIVKRVLTIEVPGKLPLDKKIELTQSILKTVMKNI
ncbi:MAG: succinylglutamate desuccinylase/aspartoacylase family protein, partial [Patescibacteria group bacterium]